MISIVIITLNEEKNIGLLLESIKNQSYKNYEVIVVDSNSTDNTEGIVKRYKKKIKKLSWHVLKKRGVSLARNTGANKAKGKYIFFMDADILFDKDFLERSVRELEEKDLGAAGVYMDPLSNKLIDKFYYRFLNFWFFIMQKIYPHCVGSCVIAQKKIHKKIQGFDETIKLAEDNDYVNRARKYGKYSMLHNSVKVSARRFEQEGRFKMGGKYFLVFFYRLLFGEIRSDVFNYRFGHYEKKDKK